MKGYKEIIDKLLELKNKGYILTHRSGDTGIGKTLEDLLGIEENNIPGPNGHMIEIKAKRKNTTSMLTLFTKSPDPRGANSELLEKYGYVKCGKKELHTTVNAVTFNNIKGMQGLKIDVRNDRLDLISSTGKILGYWGKETLANSFETKLPRLLYVKADSAYDSKAIRDYIIDNDAIPLIDYNPRRGKKRKKISIKRYTVEHCNSRILDLLSSIYRIKGLFKTKVYAYLSAIALLAISIVDVMNVRDMVRCYKRLIVSIGVFWISLDIDRERLICKDREI